MQPSFVRAPTRPPTPARVLAAYGRTLLRNPALLPHFLFRSGEAWRRFGWRGPWEVMRGRLRWWQQRSYAEWVRRYDTLTPRDTDMIRRQVARLNDTPRITVAMLPGSIDATERSAKSIFDQLYPHWELLVSGAVPTGAWQPWTEKVRTVDLTTDVMEGSIRNSLFREQSGDFFVALRPGNILAPHALFLVALESARAPRAGLIFSDEDYLDRVGRRSRPIFRTAWNDELVLNAGLSGAFLAWRSDSVRELGGWHENLGAECDWDLALRLSEQVGPKAIRHLPYLLAHRTEESVEGDVDARGRSVLEACLKRRGLPGTITRNGREDWRFVPTLPSQPLISIVVPTRDGLPHLQGCVEGILQRTAYRPIELLIVDNKSREERTVAYLAQVSSRTEVRVLRFDDEFNFAAMNNLAVREARGSVVVLLNDDTEIVSEDWLTEMVRHALRRDVGAVGAKLYYPSGAIQHAGIVLGLGWAAGHPLRGLPETHEGAPAWLLQPREVSAVTAACFAIRRDLYLEVGGMDEQSFTVSYNDVDLCLRLRQLGYRIIWTPYACLVHWESATRGLYPTSAGIRRLRQEEQALRSRWGDQLAEDPAYNPNLTLIDGSCSLAFPPRVVKPWRRRQVD